jgi:hypothetical protein
MLLISTIAFAQEPAKPEAAKIEIIDFANGQYYLLSDNGLVIFPDKPMLKERLGKYGDITINPKTREKIYDTANKDKVTKKGLEIHDMLTRIETKDKFFALQAVILEYDKVSIVKYNRTKWDDHLEQILKAFK